MTEGDAGSFIYTVFASSRLCVNTPLKIPNCKYSGGRFKNDCLAKTCDPN